MKDRIILDLCGGTGAWSKPYADAGYDVRVISLPENDVRTYSPPANVHGILAAPPCDQFSIARNHKLTRSIEKAIEVVKACIRIASECNHKWSALENPVGKLSEYLGHPKFSFQPWQYGDPWCKRTCIWGNFVIPKPTYKRWEDVPKIKGLYVRPGRGKPSLAFQHKSHKRLIRSFDRFIADTDASFRAITPQGFARAFFKANP